MIQTLYHVNEYNEKLIYPAISNAMEALNIKQDLKPEMKVVIKPNLIMAKSPSFPVTTHPLVIKAVARWLNENGITDITLADSSGGLYNAEYMKRVYNVCDLKQLEPQIKLNMDFTSKQVNCPKGFINHSFNMITPIIDADYIINICKLKTHAMTGYSGGIKNLFGVIPGLEKPQLHYMWPDIKDFSRMLLEIAEIVKPQLTIIDAIDAMEGNGPTGGTSHPLKMILAARDLYTQDYFALKLMQLDPMSIEMIKQAYQRGLVTPNDITLVGDGIPDNLTPFALPDSRKLDFSNYVPRFLQKPVAVIGAKIFKSYPIVNNDICVGCGKCAESCPPNIIKIEKNKAVLKKKGCISCFCCQEMCPVKAISVKRAL